jgi:RNA polymerase sigma-70 factor (ECF subfamily)
LNSDDSLLVDRCLKGDERAFGLLLGRYRRPVYSIIYRMVGNAEEAQDLAQEAFIRAFRNLPSYDRSRTFSNWLFKIASNLTIDYHRKRKLKTVSLSVGEEDEEGRELELRDEAPSALDNILEEEDANRTESLIRSLPESYRIVVLLRHAQDMAYEEIADTLGLPVGTVKARLHRARALLKQKLESLGRS